MAFLLQKLKKMLNKIFIKFIVNIYLNKIILGFKSKKKFIENYNYDFQNINFEDDEEARNILFSKKFFNNKYIELKNYPLSDKYLEASESYLDNIIKNSGNYSLYKTDINSENSDFGPNF